MERPTDSFKETHNITMSEEDTLFGGLVSNLQVAELLAFMTKNLSISSFKIVEVIAETSALLTPIGELLQKIPSHRAEFYASWVSDDANIHTVPESSSPKKEPEPVKPAATRPFSPYTAYDDLKPPTTPSPSANFVKLQ